MKRRIFLQNSILGAGAVGLPISSFARPTIEPADQDLIVCFRESAMDVVERDGTFYISALADPRRSQKPASISLLLQVATDSTFDNILTEQKYFAFRKNYYIVRVAYKPTADSDSLYFRFVPLSERKPGLENGKELKLKPSPVKELRRQA